MIIGLGGKIESGKTTISKILSEKYNLPIHPFAFRLKELVTACSGLDDSYKNKTGSYKRNVDFSVINDELKRFDYAVLDQNEIDHIRAIEYHDIGLVYRLLMQYIGTNIFRSRYTNHWVERFYNDIVKNTTVGFICDDIRFPNEHHAIKTMFNRLYSDNFNVTIKLLNGGVSDQSGEHTSETSFDKIKFDVNFTNEKDGIDKLKMKLDDLFSELLKK